MVDYSETIEVNGMNAGIYTEQNGWRYTCTRVQGHSLSKVTQMTKMATMHINGKNL